jgi:hypothetical protein
MKPGCRRVRCAVLPAVASVRCVQSLLTVVFVAFFTDSPASFM